MKRIGTMATIDEAEARIAALQPFVSQLDLPRTLTLKTYADAIVVTRDALARFKSLVAQVDAARRDLNAAEEQLENCNRRVLQAVEVQFGPESEQYAAAGGNRSKDRKRPVRRPDENETATAGGSPTPAA